MALEVRNFIFKKSESQAQATYRCGIWTNVIWWKKGYSRRKIIPKIPIYKPVNTPYRGTSTAQSNPDSHGYSWRWPRNKKLWIINETNCQKENQQMQYIVECLDNQRKATLRLFFITCSWDTRDRRHSAEKRSLDQKSLGNTSYTYIHTPKSSLEITKFVNI